ncbi:MAG: T9SS type A sorting domain-containing protein [Bacteroidales bacterium]|jgi:hypothetical protein|nr:T9SS type A sorting domain-containing protein [Bacteroidales bacterium]
MKNTTKKICVAAIALFCAGAVQAQEALRVHKTEGTLHSSELETITRITFSGDTFSIETIAGNITVHDFEEVFKVTFGEHQSLATNIPLLQEVQAEVHVFVNTSGEIELRSSVAMQQIILFSIDGKPLQTLPLPKETLRTSIQTSTLPVGVYVLHIYTQQGSVAKKIVKQ